MRLRKVLTTASLVFAGVSSARAELLMCQSCPTGTWSDGTLRECKNCLTTGVAACNSTTGKVTSCSSGYGLSNGTCSICPAGTYSAGGTAGCSPCPAGTYSSAGGATSCKNCLTTGVATCNSTTGKVTSCSSGYVLISGSCKKSETRGIGCYASNSYNSYDTTGYSVSVRLGSTVPSCTKGWPVLEPSYAGLTNCGHANPYGCQSLVGKYWCGGSTFKSEPCQ